ncbi:MAG TPA: serine/threonine-protein kinase, partial [Kofleriaceae bacterium]
MLEPGALVAGKLRIERILGEGGMGTVALATHIGLDQRVAIKVLKPELANQPEVVARFTREARAAAKLKSEHVCRVTDVGETADGVYIEMEYLEGHDLAAQIAQHPLTVEVAADYIVQACVAIAEAHHLGIIHRDLKPANLFLTQRLDGTPLIKVLDFGIATAPSADDFKITKTTTVMGSPGYMSPEHLRSARDVDVRSDIWAIGVILYEAVTAKLPFTATSITELAVKVVMDEPEYLANVDPRYAAI